MKGIQYFSDEYLEMCKKTTIKQRLQFLEDFRKLQEKKSPSKLISLKVREDLLQAFKNQCELKEVKYQTQIKKLMEDWLLNLSSL